MGKTEMPWNFNEEQILKEIKFYRIAKNVVLISGIILFIVAGFSIIINSLIKHQL